LVTPVRRLESVRFRARKSVRAREQILAHVATWLDAYRALEDVLDAAEQFEVRPSHPDPDAGAAARDARQEFGLEGDQPVPDICGLLEKHGVKVLLLDTRRDSFFGLSVGPGDGGPAVVVNTWDRISVERWIFTAAHELGHILLHPTEYDRSDTDLPVDTEHEADAFASEFLMPESAFTSAWSQTAGHPLLIRVLKVKRIFRVSYKTVLYRLVESGQRSSDIWGAFQRQHLGRFGDTLRKADEPDALAESEFAWQWGRSGEPDRLSPHDFVEDRLSLLVRRALEKGHISLGRGAEILGLSRDQMRQRVQEWAN
jgi:Zn-dependent peptidase ImmA (M78 family)